ncbi:dihydroorotase KNAG_0B06560 [Huiozyma naganishii CBS 8797]|uniref:dihydroorotase n=1 Tax=Huiozyma naganishii (strain ATCC MYA-139 / BCRC 22969 / CBS 8797 / KCTC 17520 / NBRC 10181 / NCYC 3082 / Yp74L-3) TaxID=1071383 RepID=J7RHR2_HUIN7|nr:hypothetical protein KNAG_0B06560 [Kazachstania naganishii CBS 8797]CCK69083.1 hypothetical protein KNAG_0B06560 [Kazachstania naganishii CBS 8797]
MSRCDEVQEVVLQEPCDMHVHVREGAMCELVTPMVRDGGVSVAYVMPNLQPPIVTVDRVVQYRARLQELAPQTTFLMSLYLSPELTPEVIHEAARVRAVHGVKCYPAGVTTNSDQGVDPNDFSQFYPVFEAMQEEGLVLNLHGEKPSSKGDCDGEGDGINVLNAEEKFLPALEKLHADFPKLRIVLEHCTTAKAIELVRKLNQQVPSDSDPVVAATITAHHLLLTVDDWAGDPVNFCKPVAKLSHDRRALVSAATSGERCFFFGSDSAPHPVENKQRYRGVSAGIFTQRYALAYVAEVFEAQGRLDTLQKFVSDNARRFYRVAGEAKNTVTLYRRDHVVPELVTNNSQTVSVVPFMPGETLHWDIRWQK